MINQKLVVIVSCLTIIGCAKAFSSMDRRNPFYTKKPLRLMEESGSSVKDLKSSNVSNLNNGLNEELSFIMNDDNEQSQVSMEDFTLDNAGFDESEGMSSFIKDKMFLGIQPTPDIIAIMTIYFVEGALGLARLAQTFLLKDELQLGPAEMSALSGLFVLPWTIKPLYGFLSDGFPIFGFRRRSYLILAGLLGSFSYAALGNNFFGVFDDPAITDASMAVVSTATISIKTKATVAALLVGSGTVALSDVVADGIVVQKTRESSKDDPKLAGGLQSLCWGSAAIGGLLSAYFSGSLLEVMGPRDVFSITAFMPLIVGGIALMIDEERISLKSSQEMLNETDEYEVDIKAQIESLWLAIKEPAVWKPALFLFLWQSTPTGEGAMLYFMTDDLGMGPEFLGRVRLVTATASLVGVWLYQKFLRTVSISLK